MSMLLRRHYANVNNTSTSTSTISNAAAGATPNRVAPKPTPAKTGENPEVKETKAKAEEPKITRSDIMKMNVATVRAYAESQGIEGANAMSGAELKRILGDRLFEESESESESESE